MHGLINVLGAVHKVLGIILININRLQREHQFLDIDVLLKACVVRLALCEEERRANRALQKSQNQNLP